MESELDQIIIDLKSDKQRLRVKAFTRFNQLLMTKLEDLQSVIEDHETLSWPKLFKSVHEGKLKIIQLFLINH